MFHKKSILYSLIIGLCVCVGQAPARTPLSEDLAEANASIAKDPALDLFEFGDLKLYFPNQSSSPEVRAKLAELSPEKTARAQSVRRWALQRAGNILFKFRKPIGVFASVKGRIKKSLPDKRRLRNWFGFKDVEPSAEQLALEEAAAKTELPDEKVAMILGAMNSFLLESSAVMATAEEEGVMFSIGLQGEVGGGRYGKGGAVSLDVFLGYNRKEETVAISLLPRVESFKNGLSGSFGAPVKLEYYWITDAANQAGGRLNGTSVYPPGLPWGSSVNELSAGRFAAIGLFGLIGADFSGGALPLVNRSKGVRALRISIPVGRSRLAHNLIEFALDKFLKSIGADLKTMFSGDPDPEESCSQILERRAE